MIKILRWNDHINISKHRIMKKHDVFGKTRCFYSQVSKTRCFQKGLKILQVLEAQGLYTIMYFIRFYQFLGKFIWMSLCFLGLHVFRFFVGPVPKARPQTLYDKIWADHLVHEAGGNSNSTHELATSRVEGSGSLKGLKGLTDPFEVGVYLIEALIFGALFGSNSLNHYHGIFGCGRID